MGKRFTTYMEEGQVQMITNLVCDKLELKHVRIDPFSKEDLSFYNARGIYYDMFQGMPTIFVINQGHLQLVLHELAHHYQAYKTNYTDTSNTPHDHTFTAGIKAVTRAMVEIFGKERWPCTPAYLRSNSIKNVNPEN